jgi:hypothetical protein
MEGGRAILDAYYVEVVMCDNKSLLLKSSQSQYTNVLIPRGTSKLSVCIVNKLGTNSAYTLQTSVKLDSRVIQPQPLPPAKPKGRRPVPPRPPSSPSPERVKEADALQKQRLENIEKSREANRRFLENEPAFVPEPVNPNMRRHTTVGANIDEQEYSSTQRTLYVLELDSARGIQLLSVRIREVYKTTLARVLRAKDDKEYYVRIVPEGASFRVGEEMRPQPTLVQKISVSNK